MDTKPKTQSLRPLPQLVGDIGGTHARFALRSNNGELSQQCTLLTAQHSDIVAAIKTYLAKVGKPTIEQAAIAIANPIDGDQIKMTNHHWTFSIEQTRQVLNLETLIFKNDLTALAMSIPTLGSQELKQFGGQAANQEKTLAVIAPGTGLGVSGLIKANEKWVALESEGGHVSLSPGSARESAILSCCWNWFGHVSAERLISGIGFTNLYRAICHLEGDAPEDLSSVEISRKALSSKDRNCEEALSIFCALLGATAGNLVLTLGAFDGLYIGGGIVPDLGDYFFRSDFRERFEDKGRFQNRLAQVPVYVIQSNKPILQGIGYVF